MSQSVELPVHPSVSTQQSSNQSINNEEETAIDPTTIDPEIIAPGGSIDLFIQSQTSASTPPEVEENVENGEEITLNTGILYFMNIYEY